MRFRSLTFLALVLLVSAPARATTIQKAAEIVCEHAMAEFAPSKPQTAIDLKRQYLNVENVSDLAIRDYEEAVRQVPDHPRMVFHVENAVLKELKEEAFNDGELAVATTNLYKQILFALVFEDKLVSSPVHLMYADYKSGRLLFSTDSPDVKERMQVIYAATNLTFAKILELHPELGEKYRTRHGIAASPLHWHLAGFGDDVAVEADQAAIAARAQREFFDPKQDPRVLDFHDPRVDSYLRNRFERAELARRHVVEQLRKIDQGSGQLIFTLPNGERVLSRRVLRAVMSARSLKPQEFVPYVRRRLKLETGYDIPDGLLAPRESGNFHFTVFDYIQALDAFSPSPYQKSEVVDMGLRHAAEEFVIVDGVGQSGENFFELSARMAKLAAGTPHLADVNLNLALQEARRGQDQASAVFETRVNIVDGILLSPELRVHQDFSKDGKPVHSGDDTILGLDHRSTDAEKARVVESFRKSLRPSGNRLAFLSSHWIDPETGWTTGRLVPEELRGGFEDAALAFEKDLRLELLEVRAQFGLTVDEIDSAMLGIELMPYENGRSGIRIFNSSPETRGRITQAIEAAGARVARIPKHRAIQFKQVITVSPPALPPMRPRRPAPPPPTGNGELPGSPGLSPEP